MGWGYLYGPDPNYLMLWIASSLTTREAAAEQLEKLFIMWAARNKKGKPKEIGTAHKQQSTGVACY